MNSTHPHKITPGEAIPFPCELSSDTINWTIIYGHFPTDILLKNGWLYWRPLPTAPTATPQEGGPNPPHPFDAIHAKRPTVPPGTTGEPDEVDAWHDLAVKVSRAVKNANERNEHPDDTANGLLEDFRKFMRVTPPTAPGEPTDGHLREAQKLLKLAVRDLEAFNNKEERPFIGTTDTCKAIRSFLAAMEANK